VDADKNVNGKQKYISNLCCPGSEIFPGYLFIYVLNRIGYMFV